MTALLDLLSRRQHDWSALAKSDASTIGTFARGFVFLHKNMAILTDMPTDEVRVDDSTMTSWWVISTNSTDREGDTLVPNGCAKYIGNFQRNPVVLLEHNPLWPVGTSVDESGAPGLIVEGNKIKAGLRHHDLTKEGRDTYKLVKAGILRGASIAFLPFKSTQLGDIRKGSLVSPRFRFDEWDCTHWSPTTQPCNPESIRMSLSRGDIESDELKKSLAAFAEKPLEYAHGWSPEGVTMPTVNIRNIQAVRLSKAQYPTVEAAQEWASATGFDVSLQADRPNCWEFVQQEGDHESSVKLAKGIEAMLVKADSKVQDCVSRKIELLVKEGYKQDQAAAIAYDHCRKLHDKKSINDKELPIDDSADDPEWASATGFDVSLQVKFDKAMDEPKKKGDGRVTHAVQSWADVMNHSKGCSQYHIKAANMLDHGPSVEMHKSMAALEKEKMDKVKAFVNEHFGEMDMDEISAAQAEMGDKKKESDKKKAMDEADVKQLEILSDMLDKRSEVIAGLVGSLELAKAIQDKVTNRSHAN